MLRVLAPGLMTSVQDLGRPGWRRLGVSAGGALDAMSLRAANLLAGNPPDEGALEIVGAGPTLAVEAESVRIACVGAIAAISVTRGGSTAQVALGRSATLRRGDVLRIGRLAAGASLMLAVEGGLAIEPVMGSRSTDLRAGFGGLQGRAFQAGDLLPLRREGASERQELCLRDLEPFAPKPVLRVLEGPQSDHFSAAERAAFFGRPYRVGPAWSRMGMRLEGAPVGAARGHDIASDGIVRGSIQIPGDGQPIVLLAECQTTGGYPKIGAVISADLPALGRLAPGATIVFERVTLEEAEAAGRAHAAFVERLPLLLSPVSDLPPSDLLARLMAANLVSGVSAMPAPGEENIPLGIACMTGASLMFASLRGDHEDRGRALSDRRGDGGAVAELARGRRRSPSCR